MNLNKLFLFLLLCISISAISQQTKDTPKLKQPKLKSFWGGYKSGNVNFDIVKTLIDSSIFVISETKERFSISRAIFVYRSNDKAEDEQTGLIKNVFNSSSYNYVNNDTLSQKWRKFLLESLKPGDQIHIADIIVRDKRNNLFYSEDIRINVQ
jgi:hypothetical protein